MFSISVPPLRDLGNDKIQLLNYFRNLFAQQHNSVAFSLTDAAKERWLVYDFPGNVRELKNVVIRLSAKHAGHTLDVADIENEFDLEPDANPNGAADTRSPIDIAKSRLQKDKAFNLDELMKETEQSYMEAAMILAHGNVSQAAKMLGVNRTTLYSRMEVYGKAPIKA